MITKIYGGHNINILKKIGSGNLGYPTEQANIFLNDMNGILKIKDRNKKFAFEMQMKKMIKEFIKDFSENILVSDNLIAFFTGIELELLLTQYLNIDSSFERKCKNSLKNSSDYEKIMKDLKKDIDLKLDYEPLIQGPLKVNWTNTINWLGSSMFRLFKYNECMYNNDTLTKELEKINQLYLEKVDAEILWDIDNIPDFLKCETRLWNELYSRFRIIKDYSSKASVRFEELIKSDAKKDLAHFKSTLTRLENSLMKHKKLIEYGVE